MDGIFISYRRDDSAGYAGRLYDRLAGHFGAGRVFMDVEGIEPGTDFVTAIEQAVAACRVEVVIMGKDWLAATDAAGRRRLDDPHDFIRLETSAALARNIRVIPVLVEGATMPRADELPPELRPLTRRQAVEISHKQWDATTGELIRVLEPLLKDSPPPPAAAQTAQAPAVPLTAEAAGTADSNRPEGGKSGKVPVRLALGALVALLAGVGIYFARGPERPPAQETTPPAAPQADATPPAAASPASTKEETPAPVVPVPATPAQPTPAPATATPPTAAAPSPATVPDAPSIRNFTATTEGDRTVLCYRVDNAQTIQINPRPGKVARTDRACIRLTLREATTFTLIAQGPGGTATSEPITVTPAPSTVAKIPAAPSEPASAPATPQASGPLRTGESWTYQVQGKWPTSPRRLVQFTLRGQEGSSLREELAQLQPESRVGKENRRVRSDEPAVLLWTELGSEFSPYLAAGRQWQGGEQWTAIPTPDLDPNWRNWHSNAKVVGQETVKVPAGSFQAWKVEAWSSRAATGGNTQADMEPTRVRFLVWYAPAVGRYVRMERSIINARQTAMEEDVFVLTAHQAP
jgi:TIR domain-containing protein